MQNKQGGGPSRKKRGVGCQWVGTGDLACSRSRSSQLMHPGHIARHFGRQPRLGVIGCVLWPALYRPYERALLNRPVPKRPSG